MHVRALRSSKSRAIEGTAARKKRIIVEPERAENE